MKYLILYLVGLLAAAIFKNLHVQVSDAIEKWSIEDCFKYASEHNIVIYCLTLKNSSIQKAYSYTAIKSLK